MAGGGLTPNTLNINRTAAAIADATSIVVHPEYQWWRLEWRKLRDCLTGQRAVKLMRELYLRPMKGQDTEDYNLYLERASFYNMTGQTQNGMLGQVFQRDPTIHNLPKKFRDQIRTKFAKDGSGLITFLKTVVGEQIGMGRCGVLVDMDANPSTEGVPYVCAYIAENIIDWTIEAVNGQYVVTRILLREFQRELWDFPSQQNPWIGTANPGTAQGRAESQAQQSITVNVQQGNARLTRPVARYIDAYTYKTTYRELILERQDDGSRIYKVNVYAFDPRFEPSVTFTPTVRGVPLNFIPFMFFGASANVADVEKSPLLDIADLNISHYRTYADLEWGRMYTALPVYYAPGNNDDGAAQYNIGPNVVWEVEAGSGMAPGILEYKGEGLKALETALDTKEQQIAAIGGRMLPGSTNKGSESNNQSMLREANEQALVLNVIQAAEAGMSFVIRWWLMWQDLTLASTISVQVELSRDFLSQQIGARELRAIQLMYNDGLVPVESLYEYLRKANVIRPDTTLDEFTAMLKDPSSFLNAPDALARQRGFDSRQQQFDQERIQTQDDFQQQELDLQEEELKLQKDGAAKVPPAAGPLPAKPNAATPPTPGKSAPVTKNVKNPGGIGGPSSK